MEEAFHVAVGLLSTTIVGAIAWRGASGLVSRLEVASAADRLLATLSVLTVQSLFIASLLALAGLFSGLAFAIAMFVVSLACWALHAPWWPGPALVKVRETLVEEPILIGIATVAFVPIALTLSHALPRPPFEYDPLNYHLVLAVHHLRTHSLSIFRFPPWFDPYSYMPAGTDLLASIAIAPFGCDLLLPLMNLPYLAMLMLSVWSLCRDAGVSRAPAAAVAAAMATMPFIFRVLTEAYAELPLFGTFMAGVRFMVLSARTPHTSVFLLAAALSGSLPGMKLNGLVLALVAFGVHVVSGLRDIRTGLLRAGLFMLSIVLFGSFFFIRNAIETGNPFYPAPVLDLFPGVSGLSERMARTTIWSNLPFLLESGRLWRALVGVASGAEGSWGLGPSGVFAIGLGLVAAVPRRGGRLAFTLFIGGLALLVSYLFMPRAGTFLMTNVRFVVPGVLLLAPAGAIAATLVSVPPLVLTGAFLATGVASLLFACVTVTPSSGLALGFLTAASLCLCRVETRPITAWRKLVIAVLGLCVLYVAVLYLHHHRESNRIAYWREATAPHQQVVHGHVDCLDALERTLPEGVVAVAAERGAASFIYPLLGSHLSRTIVYLDIGKSEDPLPHQHPHGDPRSDRDEQAWLARVAITRPDVLFAYLLDGVPPIEAVWAQKHPKTFVPITSNEACAVWRVELPAPQPGRNPSDAFLEVVE